jgi:hypothetical protein
MGACKATGNSSRPPASIRVHALRIRTRSWNSSRGCWTRDRPTSSSTFRRDKSDRSPEPAYCIVLIGLARDLDALDSWPAGSREAEAVADHLWVGGLGVSIGETQRGSGPLQWLHWLCTQNPAQGPHKDTDALRRARRGALGERIRLWGQPLVRERSVLSLAAEARES